jgi:molybdopterin synthase sulfur carrier subunit
MITVKLFAAMAEETGREELHMPWQEGLSIAGVKQWLAEQYPVLAARIPAAMIAVNQEFVTDNQVLCDGDEVALIPPVSGG